MSGALARHPASLRDAGSSGQLIVNADDWGRDAQHDASASSIASSAGR